MALGGSTNAAVHIIALAGRAGVQLDLADLDAMARRVPVITNLFPSGSKLMEDFYYAGGLPALMHRLGDILQLDQITVTGRTLGRTTARPGTSLTKTSSGRWTTRSAPSGRWPVLRGNLAPHGAVMKPSAATPALLQHSGPAMVFDSQPQMLAAMADPNLEVDEKTVLGAALCRPRRGARHARVGRPADPQEAAAARCARHAAHIRRAHERHRTTAAVSCTSAPKPRSAGRWRWCAAVTSSTSTSLSAR
jgi:hypothetical protein